MEGTTCFIFIVPSDILRMLISFLDPPAIIHLSNCSKKLSCLFDIHRASFWTAIGFSEEEASFITNIKTAKIPGKITLNFPNLIPERKRVLFSTMLRVISTVSETVDMELQKELPQSKVLLTAITLAPQYSRDFPDGCRKDLQKYISFRAFCPSPASQRNPTNAFMGYISSLFVTPQPMTLYPLAMLPAAAALICACFRPPPVISHHTPSSSPITSSTSTPSVVPLAQFQKLIREAVRSQSVAACKSLPTSFTLNVIRAHSYATYSLRVTHYVLFETYVEFRCKTVINPPGFSRRAVDVDGTCDANGLFQYRFSLQKLVTNGEIIVSDQCTAMLDICHGVYGYWSVAGKECGVMRLLPE